MIVWDRGFHVRRIADSIHAVTGSRLSTLALRYPRFIHSELMTHRAFSRNAASSRAIPVMKILRQVWNDPAMPIHWGANRKGMQAKEQLSGWRLKLARAGWRLAGKVACVFAYAFVKVGLHKQVANRILEPWQWMETLVTSSEWDNFFKLRDHADAQPEFQLLASLIRRVMGISSPRELQPGDWHMPFVGNGHVAAYDMAHSRNESLVRSSAMCAWVSHQMPDGTSGSPTACLNTFKKLTGDPLHASPLEHQAQAVEFDPSTQHRSRNFHPSWHQHRALREEGMLIAEEGL